MVIKICRRFQKEVDLIQIQNIQFRARIQSLEEVPKREGFYSIHE